MPVRSLTLLLLTCCLLHQTVASPRPKTIRVNKQTFRYLDVGKGEPVLLVHGRLADYRIWEHQMAPFAKHHRVIAYSRRYHYPNRWEGNGSDDSIMTHVNDLIALVKALHLEHVHLVGHSYGAYVALVAALRAPELFHTLTLAEPPVFPLVEGDSVVAQFQRTTIRPAAKAFQKKQLKSAVRTFMNGVLGDTAGFDKLPGSVRKLMMQNAPELGLALSSPPRYPVMECEELRALIIPTLLVSGERSPKLFHAITEKLASCMPQAVRVTINSSHALEIQDPQEFNAAVLKFIGRH